MKSLSGIILFLAMGLALTAPACKKKQTGGREAQKASSANQPLASAYVLKTAIAIHAAPEARAKALVALPIGSAVEIYASRVADLKTPDTAFWYKVKYAAAGAAAPVEGFISEREEVLRENLLVFNKKTEERITTENAEGKVIEKVGVPGVMATTYVNLRKSPALNGAVIRQVKNGELLKVLAVSASTVEIDKRRAEWYLVSDAQGQTGYCFGGYMLAGLYDELAELQGVGFRFFHGWATVTAKKAHALRSPVGADTFNLGSLPMAESDKVTSDLKQGAILQIDGETTKSTDRYRVLVRTEVEPEYFLQRYYYVAKSDVKFTGDYFSISSKQPHKIDLALAKSVNAYLKGDVNLQCTRVLPFEGGSDSEKRSFYAIQTALGHATGISEDNGKISCWGTNEHVSLLVERKDDKYVFMGNLGRGELNFTDLNGDGIPEVLSESYHGRASKTLAVSQLNEGRLVEVFRSDASGESCVSVNFKGKYLVIERHMSEQPEQSELDYCRESLSGMLKSNKSIVLSAQTREFPAYLQFDGANFQKIENPADLPADPG